MKIIQNYLNKKDKSIRNPNIDFIRIAGMFSIVINHLLTHGRAMIKYSQYDGLKLLNILGIWHVSSFGIVSGLVGIKTHKFSNLLYLWIEVVFYSVIIFFYYKFIKNVLLINSFITYIFPAIHNQYWYFTAYFGMYPFLPFINSGIIILNPIEFKKCIYFMIGIFFIWSSCFRDPFSQHFGHSPFCLLIYYIFGTYIYKYIFFVNSTKNFTIIICILSFSLYIIISIVTYKIYIKQQVYKVDSLISKIIQAEVNSFPVLSQSLLVVLLISKFKFNKYISQVVTFIGPLTFDVYLIHENLLVRNNYLRNIFNQYDNRLKLFSVLLLVFKKAFFIFCTCISISFFRNKIFRILRIKKLCIKFEIISTRIMNYLI